MCPLGLAKVPSGIIYFEIEKVGHGEGGGQRKQKGKEREMGNGETYFCMAFVWVVEKLQTAHPELFSYYLMCHSTVIYIPT